MAKGEESSRSANASARLYKSKDVHKRRAGRSDAQKQRANATAAAQHASSPDSIEDNARVASAESGAFVGADAAAVAKPQAASISAATAAKKAIKPQAAGASVAATAEGTAKPQVAGEASSEAKPVGAGERPGAPVAVADGIERAGTAADAKGDALAGDVPSSDGETPSPDGDLPAAVGDDASTASDVPASKPRRKVKGVLLGLALVVVLALVGAGAVFAWERWGRFDDHADMQGQWYVLGSTTPLTIDDKAIHLTDDVAYEYTLDEHAKTIRYDFGPMQGQGRYWFSNDRNFLAITDGDSFTDASTAFEDILHAFDDLVSSGVITGTKLPEGDGVIVFCRQPGSLASMVKEASERAKKQAEEKKARDAAEAERAEAEKQAAEEEAEARQEQEAAGVEAEEYYVEYYDNGESDVGVVETVESGADVGVSVNDEGGQAAEGSAEEGTNE